MAEAGVVKYGEDFLENFEESGNFDLTKVDRNVLKESNAVARCSAR